MSAAKHTPGPWDVNASRNGYTSEVAIEGPIREQETAPVCWIGANRISSENEANARLIAAAPELLAACRAALEFIQAQRMGSGNAEPLLLAAIKKAEGK